MLIMVLVNSAAGSISIGIGFPSAIGIGIVGSGGITLNKTGDVTCSNIMGGSAMSNCTTTEDTGDTVGVTDICSGYDVTEGSNANGGSSSIGMITCCTSD